jgi:hypothetical protein
MGTRLPVEEFSIDKNELLSQRMKLNTIDEELLLFIDNELPVEQRKVVELELKSNGDYRMQHELMLKTRLDASEKIVYPNKKELYKQEEEKLVLLRPWMRIAAAAVVIAVAGLLYFNNPSNSLPGTELAASGPKNVDNRSNIKSTQPPAKDLMQGTEPALSKESRPKKS